ncbi:MAG: phosphopyruvate hydratase [Candidatus Curtissbacteria bacterium]|nr:phosphopyruvate hydratase [Candidatus Curtissbacteria bacterium]
MAKIKAIRAREILDSRGNPTIQTTIELDDSSHGTFSCPSGASVGSHEAVEKRDGDPARYNGRGVLQNLESIVKVIAPKLLGQDAKNQAEIDQTLIEIDGTPNKANLGANTILSVSAAALVAQAASEKIPLFQYVAEIATTRDVAIPTPMFNILNGGTHANFNVDIQEFMVVPIGQKNYSACLEVATETYFSLQSLLKTMNLPILLGDEGGFAPPLSSNKQALDLLKEAASKNRSQDHLDFALDVAASNLRQQDGYKIKDSNKTLNAPDFTKYLEDLLANFPIHSIEDPFDQDDWVSWQIFTQKVGSKTSVIADDLTTTNKIRLEKAISEKAANAIIIKPNQIGTITETLEVVKSAKQAQFKIIASHRSGETNDDFIADFAVGIGASYAKFGAPARGERVAKYNRLLEIEHILSK